MECLLELLIAEGALVHEAVQLAEALLLALVVFFVQGILLLDDK